MSPRVQLKGLLEAAMDVLAARYVTETHSDLCPCAMCALQRAVDYQRKICGLDRCHLRRHEHHNRDHKFYEYPTITNGGKKPTTKAGRIRRAKKLQELRNRV